MFSKVRLRKKNEQDHKATSPPSVGSGQPVGASLADERKVLRGSIDKSCTSRETNPTEIDGQDDIVYSVAFLADREHVVSGGGRGKIRRWRVEDGKEVGKPMDAGNPVLNLAVSQDGKWIVCGTQEGQVTTWSADSYEKVADFKAHDMPACAVDISADGTRIATGSDDKMVCVWSTLAGQQLLQGPLKHDHFLAAVKFSPDARLIATATWRRKSIRIYASDDSDSYLELPIEVNRPCNGSLAWATSSEQLFILSTDGNIHCLDVSTQKTLAKWRIHSNNKPTCIALACNDTIIAASANTSLSFWDTTTHQQIGSSIQHSQRIWSMAISPSNDIATTGNNRITLRNLCNILPAPYCDDLRRVSLEQEVRRLRVEKRGLEDTVMALNARDARQKHNIVNIESTVQELRDQLVTSNKEKESSDRKIAYLQESVEELSKILVKSQGAVRQSTEIFASLRADIDAKESIPARNVADLDQITQELGKQVARSQHALHVHDKKYECETAYVHGHIYDAAQSLLEIANGMTEDLKCNKLVVDWLEQFTNRCLSMLRTIGDEAFSAKKHDEALSAYSTVLLLTPSPPEGILTRWARMALIRYSTREAFCAANMLKLTKFHACRAICEVLMDDDRVTEAIECFQNTKGQLSLEPSGPDERSQWELDFLQNCVEKLEQSGDKAKDAKNHDAAIRSYSSALSLNPENINDIIVKCCKARVGYLEDELSTATMDIERNPLSYRGYKRKHAILHTMGRYENAFKAFEMMMSSMEISPDPQIRDLRRGYLDTTPLIREVVEETIHDIPRALIDTAAGRLYDKTQQATAFEQLPIFNEMRSSMITHNRLDCARITREVEKFYEYVMFSHRWQPPEPSFQMIENSLIYGLPISPTIDKLINFCKLVQTRRFRWAWSDTCCVDQSDKGVQQESVVAMFQWYCRAALTIVHLVGVFSDTQKAGSLWKSIWNTRGWTYQEYVASRVIQFYTEDWKPYLGLEIFNHKESPLILAEMEQATKFATQALATLQPGMTSVREKLYLASKRATTRREDTAYCLFGIFNVALPVIYGEGNQAVGRLLEHILTRSDNVTILAWIGNAGSNHSYLPFDLTVYDQVVPPHVPQAVETAEMDHIITALHSSFPDPSPIVQLYERLLDVPSLSVVAGRLKLPGLVFRVTNVTPLPASGSDSGLHVYHATSRILGEVRIETKDDSIAMQHLVLVHPWISSLVDEDFEGDIPLFDLPTRAFRLVVRLRQPFGALLLASQGRVQYKRVATDSFIRVQIPGQTPLKELVESVRTVEVQ